MAVEKKQWDRAKLNAFLDGRSWWRKRRDARALKDIFEWVASSSPTCAEALAWAKEHDIVFFIDRKIDFYGYYKYGMGALAIGEAAIKGEDPHETIATIVHELRHAWQDCHGLQTHTDRSFAKALTEYGLVEADAEAFGMRAAAEYDAQYVEKFAGLVSPSREYCGKNNLAENFLAWFCSAERTESYGEDAIRYVSKTEGYDISDTDIKEDVYEFNSDLEVFSGIDTEDLEDVWRLGEGFSGKGNYMKDVGRDTLLKKILPASLVRTFWGAADPEHRDLITELRKVELREKLAQPKTLHPWP